MESDFMDENARPGAVIGPKSVPRYTNQLLRQGLITEEDCFRIHAETIGEGIWCDNHLVNDVPTHLFLFPPANRYSMFLKVHCSPGAGDIVAVCDRELLNTTIMSWGAFRPDIRSILWQHSCG